MDDKGDNVNTEVKANGKPDSSQCDSTSSPVIPSRYEEAAEIVRFHTNPAFLTCPNCERDINTEVTIKRHHCSCSHACCSCLLITFCGICLAALTGNIVYTEHWGWDRTCKTKNGTEYKHKCPLCKFLLASWIET